jgi:hypothetical protein
MNSEVTCNCPNGSYIHAKTGDRLFSQESKDHLPGCKFNLKLKRNGFKDIPVPSDSSSRTGSTAKSAWREL